MAIGSSSPFDHNAFAAASGLTASPWAKQPNHSYIHKPVMQAETQTFNATPVAPSTPTKKWESVHKTGNGVNVPIIRSNYIYTIVPGGASKKAASFKTYSSATTKRVTNGYTELENNSVSKSGAAKVIPANQFKITGAVYFPSGVKSWTGDQSNSATGEYATKSGKEVRFSIIGAGSWIQVDVDSEHGGFGNSIKLSNGAKGDWSKPNQDVTIKIWNIYYQVDTCPTGRYLTGGKCKSKGCKDNKYTQYTSLDVISTPALCTTCKDSGGTGYTTDSNCNKVAKAGYIIKNGVVKKRGCTNSKYEEYDKYAYPDSSYCKTCKDKGGTGYTVGAGCKRIAKAGYTLVGNVPKTVGCKDSLYTEYNANAQVGQQHLCLTCKSGYIIRDGKCKKEGCTDSNASNYDNNAEVDDGSCSCKSGFAKDSTSGKCVVTGCTDAGDTGYNSKAVIHDTTSCSGVCKGDMVTQNGRCVDPAKQGCMDADADNYDSTAAQDDGSCTYSCADGNRVTTDKGTCGDTCNDGYSLVNGVCEEIVEVPDEPALEEENGDTTVDTTVTTQTTDVTTTTPAAPKSKTGLIIGGVAVVGLLGFMMMRKKAPAAAEWYGY